MFCQVHEKLKILGRVGFYISIYRIDIQPLNNESYVNMSQDIHIFKTIGQYF